MKPLLRLKPYLRPFLGLIITSAVLAIPLSALRLSPVAMIRYLLDDLLKSHDQNKLYLFPLIMIGLYLVNFVVRFFHYYLLRVVVARVNQKLKNELFEHVLGLSADYFSGTSTGNLISRVGSDPFYVDQAVSSINVLIREPITFVFLLCYTLYVNWKLTIVTFVIFPPLAWVFTVTGRNLKRYISRITEENANLYSSLQESFTGIRVIKMFRLEKYVRKKYRSEAERYATTYLKVAKLEEAAHPLVELLIALVISMMIYFGGRQVLAGRMQEGELLSFFAAFFMMINPIRTLNEVSMKLHQSAAACQRIFELFDWKPSLHEVAHPKSFPAFQSQIEFRDVSFAYPDAPERSVLKNVSFTVPKGKTYALVGASGAGKSSLISLLPRIFDVTGGAILIDGEDIRELVLDDLRKQIAVVSQDVFLFNDTIEENIRCGRLSASSEEIRDAARRAHVTEFAEQHSDGFQTEIGDRGMKLSGGQRQRLSIARAFLRASPILILDEATSSLDTASEKVVQNALDELMQNRTVLVIAHRLSTIRHADRILVLHEGSIVESGTHQELIQKNGHYAHLHRQGELE